MGLRLLGLTLALLARFCFRYGRCTSLVIICNLVLEARLLFIFPSNSHFRFLWIFPTVDGRLPGFQDVNASVNLVRTHEQLLIDVVALRIAAFTIEAGDAASV